MARISTSGSTQTPSNCTEHVTPRISLCMQHQTCTAEHEELACGVDNCCCSAAHLHTRDAQCKAPATQRLDHFWIKLIILLNRQLHVGAQRQVATFILHLTLCQITDSSAFCVW